MTESRQRTQAQATESDSRKVRYTGFAGTREITAAQWKSAGVEGQNKVVWNAENEYALPLSEFSEDALRVLERDPNIKVS